MSLTKTHYIQTTQAVPMFAIVLLDGEMIQKIGHYGDGDIFEAIEFPEVIEWNSEELLSLDLDAIIYHDTTEE